MATIKTSPGKGELPAAPGDQLTAPTKVSLRESLSSKTPYVRFETWIVGDTPLIVHAWSQKAKLEMLSKQVKAVKAGGRAARDPEQDFVDSLYDLGDGTYGFPTTGIKKAILTPAHKDKGIAKSVVLSSLWLNTTIVRAKPAFAGAICDMPITRVYGSKPEMREDMVRVGVGLNKTASLAYRAQFRVWAMKLTGRFNGSVLPPETLSFLTNESGLTSGLGEWRNEKSGVFGAYHIADEAEERAWEEFKSGRGPLPEIISQMAAE
jgi:hypothetical protein